MRKLLVVPGFQGTESSSRCLYASKAAFAGFGANHEDEICYFNLTIHPPRPPYRGRLLVLVDTAIDALLT